MPPETVNAVAAILSVLLGLGVGTLWGIAQGYIIAYLRVTAFIVTLGSYFILQGLTLLQTEGKTIPANQPVFAEIGQGYLPAALSWILAVVVISLLTGTFVLRLVHRLRPQVALLDISMPGMNGITAAMRLPKVSPATKVVFLSMFAERDFVIRALEAGARGYVTKPYTSDQLLNELRAL